MTGTIDAPERLVLGFHEAGKLAIPGSTAALTGRQCDKVAPLLRSPAGEHPWPTEIGFGRLGHWGGSPTTVTLVARRWSSRSPRTPPSNRAAGGT